MQWQPEAGAMLSFHPFFFSQFPFFLALSTQGKQGVSLQGARGDGETLQVMQQPRLSKKHVQHGPEPNTTSGFKYGFLKF